MQDAKVKSRERDNNVQKSEPKPDWCPQPIHCQKFHEIFPVLPNVARHAVENPRGAQVKILDFSKPQCPPQRGFCMALKPIFDRQLKPLQFLNAEHIGPAPGNFGA
jgi:hypothetical protein